MIPRYLLFAIPLLIGIFIGVTYEFVGGKEYVSALRYIYSLNGEHKIDAEKGMFGNKGDNLYNGILASGWKNGLWIWGRYGLVYFSIDSGVSKLRYRDQCSGNSIIYQSAIEWSKKVGLGTHISILYSKDLLLPKVISAYGTGVKISREGPILSCTNR